MFDAYQDYIVLIVVLFLLFLLVAAQKLRLFSYSESIESLTQQTAYHHCESDAGSNEINFGESVYSSFPKEKERDNGYNYTIPLSDACLARKRDKSCTPGQRFMCGLTPHNQWLCHWK